MEESVSGSVKEEVKAVTPIEEILQLVCQTAEQNCNLGKKISPKELPKGEGLYAEVGDGFPTTTYYNKHTEKIIPILFLCRSKSQQKGLEQLSSICNYLQRLKKYPQGNTMSWLDTTIAKEPSKIGRDEDGTYHCSCIINCKIYY